MSYDDEVFSFLPFKTLRMTIIHTEKSERLEILSIIFYDLDFILFIYDD